MRRGAAHCALRTPWRIRLQDQVKSSLDLQYINDVQLYLLHDYIIQIHDILIYIYIYTIIYIYIIQTREMNLFEANMFLDVELIHPGLTW